jgi:hypothetical protein
MSIRMAARSVAGLATVAIMSFALAQTPTSVEEQVRLFRSMSPVQQQALIRELQRTLPPAQREAIIRVLQGDGNVAPVPATSAPEGAPGLPQ